jgi:hypothetical protein
VYTDYIFVSLYWQPFDGNEKTTLLIRGIINGTFSMRWVVEYYEQADTTQPASISDLNQASDYWRDYQHTHKISPEVPEQEERS